jgi:hypothetical protein
MNVRFEVHHSSIKTIGFWCVTTLSVINIDQNFEETCLLNYAVSHPEKQ